MKKTKRHYRILFLLFMVTMVTASLFFKKSYLPQAASALNVKVKYDKDTPTKSLKVDVVLPSGSEITSVKYVKARVGMAMYFTKYASKCTTVKADSTGAYSFSITSNGYVSVYAATKDGREGFYTFKVDNVDTEAPVIEINSIVIGSGAYYEVTASVSDNFSSPVKLQYVSGSYASATDSIWKKATELEVGKKVKLKADKYTFLATDTAGNTHVIVRRFGEDTTRQTEFRAVWIAYYDFKSTGYTEATFRAQIEKMFNEVSAMNMNAVIVHVRPFSDAMYPSKYFPWSKYCSGTQGVDPGFDPLKIMIEEAHLRGLEFHAWLNPYRVSNTTTDITTLSKDNPARIYRTDNKTSNDRNVLTYDGKLFYNPASTEVQTLILNGIKEIVDNYDVDGIHFDDYFYPSLGKNYQTNFDAKEYESYKKKQISAKKSYLSIADWRRENVNKLVRTIYSSIKAINPNVVFGISPGGFMNALRADDKYYVDFDTWVSYDGYIDYLCPQLYWSNDHSIYPFNNILDRFIEAKKNPDVKLYVGIAAYKVGIKTEGTAWYQNANVLKNMITYGRSTGNVDGYVLFDYSHIIKKKSTSAIKNLLTQFK